MSYVRCLAKEMADLDASNGANNEDELNSTSGCEMSFDLATSPSKSVENLTTNGDDDGGVGEFSTPPSIKHRHHYHSGSNTKMNYSPPYKRVRALRLFDSPLTPKTILQKSDQNHEQITPAPRGRLFSTEKPRGVPSCYGRHESKPAANVNPFTPTGMMLTKKRTRSPHYYTRIPKLILNDCEDLNTSIDNINIDNNNFNDNIDDDDDDDDEIEQPTKRVALQENNISRYHQEFHEIELIGIGQFGSVYKCINRLDGCIYAIKKSKKPVAGSQLEKRALNEVYAHAVLGKHQNVVRYYSAWAEDNHMIIQNEYCNGGSLAQRLYNDQYLNEQQLKILLLHCAEGLRYIHSEGLVHLDIKPDNIFITKEKRLHYDSSSCDDGFEDYQFDDNQNFDEITYKIGDLGHVTSINNPQQLEEGDSRYLAKEILHENYTNLIKADIFALGITILEASGYKPIPKNGEEWHQLRNGYINLTRIPQKLNPDFINLIKQMLDIDVNQRPTAIQILHHTFLQPIGKKTKAQLHRELNAEKLKNEILSKQLQEAAKCIKQIAPQDNNNNNNNTNNNNNIVGNGKQLKSLNRINNRLLGKKVNRSVSTTTF